MNLLLQGMQAASCVLCRMRARGRPLWVRVGARGRIGQLHRLGSFPGQPRGTTCSKHTSYEPISILNGYDRVLPVNRLSQHGATPLLGPVPGAADSHSVCSRLSRNL